MEGWCSSSGRTVRNQENRRYRLIDIYWKLYYENFLKRGEAIEKSLAETTYKDYWHCGAEQAGLFPLIDFQKGHHVVQVKSMDTTCHDDTTLISTLQWHVRRLSDAKVTVGKRKVRRTLHLVTPAALPIKIEKRIKDYAKTVGVVFKYEVF